MDFSLQVIIAPSFADIFYGNAINNSMLPIRLTDAQMDILFAELAKNDKLMLTVDLNLQLVKCADHEFDFTIAEHHKHNLIKGLDAIGQTLEHADAITEHEKRLADWF